MPSSEMPQENMEHGGIAGDTEIFGLFVGIFGTESMYYFGDPLADKPAELAEPSLFAGNNPADNISAIAALGIEAGPGCENLPVARLSSEAASVVVPMSSATP